MAVPSEYLEAVITTRRAQRTRTGPRSERS